MSTMPGRVRSASSRNRYAGARPSAAPAAGSGTPAGQAGSARIHWRVVHQQSVQEHDGWAVLGSPSSRYSMVPAVTSTNFDGDLLGIRTLILERML